MNANWGGLLGEKIPAVSDALGQIITRNFGTSTDAKKATQWYSVLASGPGIVGLGSRVMRTTRSSPHRSMKKDIWDITNPQHLNGGVNHFGSPFNFPEEFVTVYRLHSLVPDLIEYRDLADPNAIRNKIPVVETFQAKSTDAVRSRGLANWAVSMGRQRLGLLALGNTPQFLQNIRIPRLNSETKQIDVAALDLIRDREHGVPRFNEFRRQYGLRQLTSFDDFIDQHTPADSKAASSGGSPDAARGLRPAHVRRLQGDHGHAGQSRQSKINDCLGHPNGSMVDNVEDVDTVVGWLAESTRPHGFAISETQFVVFILNASRRLFSDRFFTSSFRPEFYTQLGIDWVNNNGPGPKQMEKGTPNGHAQPVSPLKRVLLRTMPELAAELDGAVNAFDPWARDRGEFYSLEWKPRRGAESDEAFTRSSSGELGYDRDRATDRDRVFQQGDRQVLPAGRFDYSRAELIAAERARNSAYHARDEGADQGLTGRAESGTTQSSRYNSRAESQGRLPARCLRQLVRDQFPDREHSQDVRRRRIAEKGETGVLQMQPTQSGSPTDYGRSSHRTQSGDYTNQKREDV